MSYRDTFIASPASDSIFLIGIPVIALAGVMTLLHFNVLTLTAFVGFTAIFTGAHHLPGFLRAYGTREIFQANRARLILAPLLIFSLVLFFEFKGLRGYIVVLWFFNWWHTAMQNYGLLRVYDRKALPLSPYSAKLDLISIIVWHFTASELLSADMRFELARHLYDLNVTNAAAVSSILWTLRSIGIIASIVLLILYVRNSVAQFRQNKALAINKQIFLGVTYGLYVYMFQFFTEDISTSVESFYHNTQYLFFAWVMQRRLAEKEGTFNVVGSLFSVKNAAIAGLGYLGLVAGWGLMMGGSIKPRIHTEQVVPLFNAFYTTAAFLHYYTDSFIWKARSREMTTVLGLKGAGIEMSPRSFGFSFAEVSAWILIPILITTGITNPANRAHDGIRNNAGVAGFSLDLLRDGSRWKGAAVASADLGDFLSTTDHPEKSIEWYRRAVAARPDYADAYQALGHLYSQEEQFTEAAEAYEKAVALDPNFKASFNNLGNAYNVLGNFEKASAAYQHAIALDARFADAYLNLANLQAGHGDLAAAKVNYERVLALEPKSSEALRSLGQIAGQEGRFEDAASLFSRTIQIAPNDAQNYLLLAKSYVSRGDSSNAEINLNLALDKDAKFTEARLLKSQMYMSAGKLNDAAAALEDAVRVDPGNPEAQASLGSVYFKLSRLEDADRHLQEAIRLDPNFSDAYYLLAQIWEKRDKGIAIMYLNQAVRNGDHPEARKRLEELQIKK